MEGEIHGNEGESERSVHIWGMDVEWIGVYGMWLCVRGTLYGWSVYGVVREHACARGSL